MKHVCVCVYITKWIAGRTWLTAAQLIDRSVSYCTYIHIYFNCLFVVLIARERRGWWVFI